jgi:hypothetical protein
MVDPGRVEPNSIPVIINNFNRLDTLKTQVEWLLAIDGPKSIIILDNDSAYPPLLEYYRSFDFPNAQVVFLGYNSGLEGIEDVVRELKRFPKYVLTDPDLVPYASTPSDILVRMSELLDKYTDYSQVGASMEIDDIPESYPLRDEVRQWESRFWPPRAKQVGDGVYEAWVDTTFGMYRSTSDVTRIDPALRMDRPYTLKHVDWYMDPDNLSAEQEFYLRACGEVASWTTKLLQHSRESEPEGQAE